jgi:hypothetical protein
MALETFMGDTITAEDIVEFINTPENALLLQHDAHQEYDGLFSWGIEAVSGSDGVVSLILVLQIDDPPHSHLNRIGSIPVSSDQGTSVA